MCGFESDNLCGWQIEKDGVPWRHHDGTDLDTIRLTKIRNDHTYGPSKQTGTYNNIKAFNFYIVCLDNCILSGTFQNILLGCIDNVASAFLYRMLWLSHSLSCLKYGQLFKWFLNWILNNFLLFDISQNNLISRRPPWFFLV